MSIRATCVMAALALASGLVLAQGAGAGPGAGPGPAASAPRMGMGMGMGGGPRGGMMGPRWGADYTPGWGMMSAQERNEHRDKMRAMKTYDECKAYQQQHHDLMAARAKERGRTIPAQPRRDPCVGMPK